MQKLQFDNRFLREFSEIAVPVPTTPVRAPRLLAWSEAAGELLGLDSPREESGVEARIFSGNELPAGGEWYATRYGGHQFGHWAGQLGDGRAIFLGEARATKITDNFLMESPSIDRIEIQLKGAGQTPFSRRGDGRAVLRSSLREFLCSEAMFHLGVPTTRALCCVLTGEEVIRDMFYDGHPRPEPGAITTRLSPSFLRLGHFQILAADDNAELMGKLVDFTIDQYFPRAKGDRARWFTDVCERTAALMVHWQRVGFVHGVMNTDNLSVLGLTIDYGPYGWMDIYDPDWTPNTTDEEHRRYRFGQQPAIALWNLQRFAEALAILTPEDAGWLQNGLQRYATVYNDEVLKMMARKLGLPTAEMSVITGLDEALRSTEVDMTIFYRLLSKVRATVVKNPWEALDLLSDAFYRLPVDGEALKKFEFWLDRYLELVRADTRDSATVAREMDSVNPYFILRNFLVQEALDGLEKDDRSGLDSLMRALATPYEENEATRPHFRKMPDWARDRPGCSALSCSS